MGFHSLSSETSCHSWPLLLTWLTSISACINNNTYYKVLAEITYPFPNLNGTTVDVWEWISNFIPCLLGKWLPIHARIKVIPCKKGGSGLVNSLCHATTSQWSYYPAICEVHRQHYCRGISSVLEQSRNSKPISRGCDILRDLVVKVLPHRVQCSRGTIDKY